MDKLFHNLSYSIRTLLRTPLFTLAVVVTLALGIGANTTVFSVIDAVLIKELPYHEAERLVQVMQFHPDGGESSISPVRLEEWNELNSTFEAITGYFTEDVSESSGDVPERVRWAAVAPRFLDVWKISPALGRHFVEADSAQRPTVVMISERLWRKRFSSDPEVIGKSIRLGDPGGNFTVIGVLPGHFQFTDRKVDVWFPNFTNYNYAQSRNARFYTGVGRLKAGVTIDQAIADMKTVQAALGKEFPDTDKDISVSIQPLRDTVVGNTDQSLWLLFGAVTVLLLIACTNIAALLLSRSSGRRQDIMIRYAMGASRFAIAVQMLTETLVLASVGAVAGIMIVVAAVSIFRWLAPDLPRLDEVVIDYRILLYTLTCAIVVTLLCGLYPAFRFAHSEISPARSGRTQVSSSNTLQWCLVGVQVAMSVMLLAGAGLLLRSFEELSRVDPGFEPDQVLAFRVSASNFEYAISADFVAERINKTMDELTAMPGVAQVANASLLPGVDNPDQNEITVVETGDEKIYLSAIRYVSSGYFRTLQVPLLTGEFCRSFPDRDVREVVVNRSFAERYFPGREVIGLHISGQSPDRITGIIADSRDAGLNREPVPTVYSCTDVSTASPWFLIRTAGSPVAVLDLIRNKVNQIEPTRAVYKMAPLMEHIGDAFTENRLRTVLLSLFAAAALLLACLGVYGTLSYVINLRRREVGLRIAVGALRKHIVSQFMLKALGVVGIASVVGLVLSFAFTRLLSGMLYGVTPSDPVTLFSVIALVIVVAVLASLLPSVRASRQDPMQALREE